MIRSDLVVRVSSQNPHLHDKACEAIVSVVINRIADAVVAGDRVEIRGFGAFSIKQREARQRRNPKTGEAMSVEGKASIQFKPGKEIRARMNAKSFYEEREPASRRLRASCDPS